MPFEDNNERCSVRVPVDLRGVCVSQGLLEEIPIALVGGDVMA